MPGIDIERIKGIVQSGDDARIARMVRDLQEHGRKRYGIVWEEGGDGPDSPFVTEKVVDECALNVPYPCFQPSLSTNWQSDDADGNLLLEGDNYAWLTLLQETHKGRVNVIYIDPPYNTGHRDFQYDDHFIDASDSFRHSQWLDFMDRRLRLARELLTDDGVIIVSCDDNEQAHLKMLMDEEFGTDCFYGEMIQLKGNTQNDSKTIQRNHEYILVYSKTPMQGLLTYRNVTEVKAHKDEFVPPHGVHPKYYIDGTQNGATGNHNTLSDRPNLGYTIYYIDKPITNKESPDETTIPLTLLGFHFGTPYVIESKDGSHVTHAIAIPDYDKSRITEDTSQSDVYSDVTELIEAGYTPIRPPVRKGGRLDCWTWGIDTFRKYWNDGEVVIRNGRNVIRKQFVPESDIIERDGKTYYRKVLTLPLQSVIDIGNAKGSTELSGNDGVLPGCSFNNPKSVELQLHLVGAYYKPDPIVLDFFAGSGTTAQAVMRLNEEDGGHRHWILCTNNESRDGDPSHGICRSITKPRLDTVITGVRPDGSRYSDGYASGYQYHTLGFIPRRKDDYDGNLMAYSRPPIVTGIASIRYGCHLSVRDDSRHAVILDSASSRVLIPFDVRGHAVNVDDVDELVRQYMENDVTGKDTIVLMPSLSSVTSVIKARLPSMTVKEQSSLVGRRFLS